MQDESTLHSVSNDMHNKENAVQLNYYDCNNNSKTEAKCTISQQIIYKEPKYIILKAAFTKTNQKEDGQETFTSLEEMKCSLPNEDSNVSYSHLSSYKA